MLELGIERFDDAVIRRADGATSRTAWWCVELVANSRNVAFLSNLMESGVELVACDGRRRIGSDQD